MALNTSNIGKPLCIVKDNKKLSKTVFSVSSDDEKGGFHSYDLVEGYFQVIPDVDIERTTMYIAGTSGSGKSFFTAEYVKQYHKYYPNNAVYLITEGEDEPAFHGMNYIKKVNLEGIEDDPLDYTEFEDTLVIFDDIDAMRGKLGKYINELRDKLLKNSRKKRVSVISTSHSFTGKELQSCLNESQYIVFFLSNYNKSMKYLLESYIGLSKEGISQLRKTRSRWCCFVKSYPNVIIQEKKIQTINHLQD